MKKLINKLLLSLLLLLVSIPIWSQPNLNDSIEVNNYWLKRGIIEVVYAYMQDYVVKNPKASAEKMGLIAYQEKFIKGINNKSIPDIENDFKSLNDFLFNNNWKSTATILFSPLKEKLEKKQITNNDFFSVIDTPGPSYRQVRQRIINNYNDAIKNLESKSDRIEPISKTENENGAQELTSKAAPQKFPYNSPWLIYAFILGIILGGLFVYFYLKQKVSSILKSEKYEYDRIISEYSRTPVFLRFLSYVEIIKNRKNEYKLALENNSVEQLNDLKKEVANLKRMNKEIFDENIDLGQKLESLKSHNTLELNGVRTENETSNNPKTFFFSIPENDGSFKIESAKNSKEQDSFYKLDLISNTNGNIYFLSGDFDLRAIENIDYYLNPVCEVQNIVNRASAKKVEMINHGTVILKGDSWQINKKVKIKLI